MQNSTQSRFELPNDIILHVFSYLYSTCKINSKESFAVSKKLNEKFFKRCVVSRYEPIKSDSNMYGSNTLHTIKCCFVHSEKHVKELVNKLNGLKIDACNCCFPHIVRFTNKQTCRIAMKYLLEYGIVSHLRENNTCAVLMSFDDMLNTFV